MFKVHPIGFSIPAEKVVSSIPQKTRFLSPLIPGNYSTYIYDDEESYYQNYKESMFAITHKKSGWDCCRHYEILACGCLPFFSNLESCPLNTMTFFPKVLILKSNELFVKLNAFTFDTIPSDLLEEYNQLVEAALGYTKLYLTTDKMALSILERVGKKDAKKILYLGQDPSPDYLRCLTLHGFKILLGQQCTDYPKIPHIYKNKDIDYHSLYGKGHTYSNLLDESFHNSDENESNIIEKIQRKEYDLIVYGSYHRGMPHYDFIQQFYKPEEIVLLCGEDIHSCNFHQFLAKGHHVFVREL